MANNIEKMYELAEIFYKDLDFCHDCCNFKENKCICQTELVYECLPFTPEKQLELIKWLCVNTNRNYFKIKADYSGNNWYMECNLCVCPIQKDFSQALASLVCELRDDLTDKQREEIRGILR